MWRLTLTDDGGAVRWEQVGSLARLAGLLAYLRAAMELWERKGER